jgi:SAM-dependent methyltransferase
MSPELLNTVELQALHYNRIAEDYALHYGDKYSQEYRSRFINQHLFNGLELKGKKVLEAMCGSGETTAYLLEKGAEVTGLDVSRQEIRKFKKRWPGADGVCASIFETELPDESFDCIVVVGGLHHLHPNLSEGLKEMHRLLKPNGYLCFAEPHAESVLNRAREFWYRHDDLFAENEEAIDMPGIKNEFSDLFAPNREFYGGNLGYLLVLNSMVFRIPQRVKQLYSPFFLWLESKIEKIQTAKTSCMVIAQWQKK